MNKAKRGRPITGWINLNKPYGMSSAQALNKIKWLLKPQKIGHAGTLDPLATGVLAVALGECTKCINLLMDATKTYAFSVTFGERRSTDDAEGDVVATSTHIPSDEEIRAALPRFTGTIEQMPPAFSALKINGKRAYDLARAGEEVELKTRSVTVYNLLFLGFSSAEVADFRCQVSKGTYIRSLGRDLAQACGSEGYISRLHRSAVGPFADPTAISLDFLEESVHKAAPNGALPDWILPPTTALDDIPALAVSSEQLKQLRHGQPVLAEPIPDHEQLALLHDGNLVGLARSEQNRIIPVRLLNVDV